MSHRLHPNMGTKRSQRVPAIAALFFVFYSLASYGQQMVDVVAQNYRFQPQEVQIHPGDSVRWLNHEKRTSHSIVFSDANGGESERIFPDESWQRCFDIPGTYPYQCGPYPEMTGKVIVLTSTSQIVCNKAELKNNRKVHIGPDKASVEITQENAPAKRLVLRPNLLPEVHYLEKDNHALLVTRDGWILRLDLDQAKQISETKLNAVVSSTALSAPRLNQNRLLAVANETPGRLTIVDEYLRLVKTITVVDKTGRIASGLLNVRTAVHRDSFIVLLADAPELWELSYNPKAPEIGLGMVHDFQYREGYFVPGYLNPQRTTLPSLAQDFVILNSGHEVLTVHGSAREVITNSDSRLYLTHLDVRKPETQSTPRFLPDKPELSWIQVDPQTLPKHAANPELRVLKSTLQFSEALQNADKTATGLISTKPCCETPR